MKDPAIANELVSMPISFKISLQQKETHHYYTRDNGGFFRLYMSNFFPKIYNEGNVANDVNHRK